MTFSLGDARAVLARTPTTLRALIDGLHDAWVTGNEGEGTFTPFDRFAHRQMMSGRSLGDLLDRFDARRRSSLETLDALAADPRVLDLTGTHPTFGQVTARQLLATWVVHDLSHLAQIARVMAHRYSDDVGPWRAFLPILDATRRDGGT